MKTAKQVEREAKRLFRLCVVRGKVDEKRVRFVAQSVLESKRRGYLLIIAGFKRLLKHEYAQHTAEIETAVPMPSDLRTRVQTGLTSVYGPGLTWQYVHNPELIGGMRIKVGSDVYDGTVRSALAGLARSFGIAGTNGARA